MNHLSCFVARLSAVAMIFLLSACVVAPQHRPQPHPQPPQPFPQPQPQARSIGTLEFITGPNAYYDRANTGNAMRVGNGQRVFEGDRIFTGPGTRMTLRFDQGGYAELDENTDPVPRFLQDLSCLIVDLLRTGRMFVDASQVCVGAQGAITRQDSQVVYDVRGGYAQVTVAGGRAELRRPRLAQIPAGYRLDANARQVLGPGQAYPLTRQQVEDAVQWTRWYRQTRPQLPGTLPPPPRPPPPAPPPGRPPYILR